jgi:hypothetical protein
MDRLNEADIICLMVLVPGILLIVFYIIWLEVTRRRCEDLWKEIELVKSLKHSLQYQLAATQDHEKDLQRELRHRLDETVELLVELEKKSEKFYG